MTIKWSVGIRVTTVDLARYWGCVEICVYFIAVAFFGVQLFLRIDVFPKIFAFAQNNYDLKRDELCIRVMIGCTVFAAASFLMTLGTIARYPPLILAWSLTTPYVIVYGMKLILQSKVFVLLPVPCFQAFVFVSVAIFVIRIYQVKVQDIRHEKLNQETPVESFEFVTIPLDEQKTYL